MAISKIESDSITSNAITIANIPDGEITSAKLHTTLDLSSKNVTLNSPIILGNTSFDTDTLYIDAANNLIGIGTSSPSVKLNVTGTVQITGSATYPSSGAGIELIPEAVAGQDSIQAYNRDTGSWRNLGLYTNETKFYNGSVLRLNIGYQGKIDHYPGVSGSAFAIHNGGDLTIFSANDANASSIWVDSNQSGMSGEYVWMQQLNLHNQKCGYDRLWDNYPAISVRNDTTNGPQGEYRIHGIGGISGGDFSVYLRVDGGGNASDARRKTDIEDVTNAINTITQLRPIKYVATNSELEKQTEMSMANGKRFGFLAQDLIPIIPEVVKDSGVENVRDNGWADQYAVDYSSMVSLLTKAIQEQQEVIEDLKARITILESQ